MYVSDYLVMSFILFILCQSNLSSKEMILDQLKNPKLTNQSQQWSFITDKVMGGVSTGKFIVEKVDGVMCYRMIGDVSTKNNGGFIQSRVGVYLNSNDFEGIRLKIRGNNNEYFVHLRAPRMMPWNYYYAEFYATNEWQIIELPLSSFKYSRNQKQGIDFRIIRSIGLVAYGKDFTAQLDIANIELY